MPRADLNWPWHILATPRLPSPPWFEDPQFESLAVASALSCPPPAREAKVPLPPRLRQDFPQQPTLSQALWSRSWPRSCVPPSEVDPSRPMYSYGVDSLVALEVRTWITREMKANMALLDRELWRPSQLKHLRPRLRKKASWWWG